MTVVAVKNTPFTATMSFSSTNASQTGTTDATGVGVVQFSIEEARSGDEVSFNLTAGAQRCETSFALQ